MRVFFIAILIIIALLGCNSKRLAESVIEKRLTLLDNNVVFCYDEKDLVEKKICTNENTKEINTYYIYELSEKTFHEDSVKLVISFGDGSKAYYDPYFNESEFGKEDSITKLSSSPKWAFSIVLYKPSEEPCFKILEFPLTLTLDDSSFTVSKPGLRLILKIKSNKYKNYEVGIKMYDKSTKSFIIEKLIYPPLDYGG